jgi:hypothetical protein
MVKREFLMKRLEWKLMKLMINSENLGRGFLLSLDTNSTLKFIPSNLRMNLMLKTGKVGKMFKKETPLFQDGSLCTI